MIERIQVDEYFDKYVPVSATVDFVTVTTQDADTAKRIESFCKYLLQSLKGLGWAGRPWSGFGYKGWACGPVKFGNRKEGSICQVAGEAAHLAYWELPAGIMKCTRLDFALTYYVKEPLPLVAELMYHRWRDENPGNHRPVEGRLIKSFTGDTFYIGKRDAARFIRVYDKGGKNGRELGQLWRIELEMKKYLADSVWASARQGRWGQEEIYEASREGLGKAGVVIRKKSDVQLELSSLSLQAADYATTLEWLSTTVRPAITRLQTAGYGEAAASAIGAHHEYEQLSIIEPLAIKE